MEAVTKILLQKRCPEYLRKILGQHQCPFFEKSKQNCVKIQGFFLKTLPLIKIKTFTPPVF